MLKKRFFKTKDDCEITFEIEAEGAEQVELVCESNGWQPIAMKRVKRGPFKTRVRLPKDARYQFRYRVDGQRWINDDAADAYWPNEFGGRNGVLSTEATQ